MKNKLKKEYLKHYKELNEILNEWDFLGVIDKDNQDEYTDIINPVLKALEKGVSQVELSEVIVNFVAKDYGYSPSGTYEVSGKIIKWWSMN